MKPRNETERHFVALAAKLPPITARQRKYAYDHVLGKYAIFYRNRRDVKCMCCGRKASYPPEYVNTMIDNDEYCCPHCGESMSLKSTGDVPDSAYTDRSMFVIVTVCVGYQVVRVFDVTRYNHRGDVYADLSIGEVYDIWITDDGCEIITGRRVHRSVFALSWDFAKPIDIRQHNGSTAGSYAFEDLYDITGALIYPEIRVTPLIRRNGWAGRFVQYHSLISMADLMRALLNNPTAEMLAKTGQDDLLVYMLRRHIKTLNHLHAVRIANRHGYIVTDASMWLDMLSMAAELGLDTHNPQIVCPADLKDAHDRILARVTRRRRIKRAADELRKAAKENAAYQRAKGMYFGICLVDGDLTVSVIRSVSDILAEGTAMHHCVYDMGYYRKPGSLILSARDKDGNRIETVELSLDTYKVLQSRGVCNSCTPDHARIINLVESHADLFRERKMG